MRNTANNIFPRGGKGRNEYKDLPYMKTSDKILLISSLSSIGIFGLVHLALYAKYRRGDILMEKNLHAQQLAVHPIPAPRWLVVRGLLRTHIIPSDSFAIEFLDGMDEVRRIRLKQAGGLFPEKVEEPFYHREGDTLFIEGDKGQEIDQQFASQMRPAPFPIVNVYCRGLELIEMEGGQITLVGGTRARPAGANLAIRNGVLWVGQYHSQADKDYPDLFDTVQVRASGSTVMLNNPVMVARLQANLTNHSLIDDRNIDIGQLALNCDSTSKVSFTGKNLQKLRPAGP